MSSIKGCWLLKYLVDLVISFLVKLHVHSSMRMNMHFCKNINTTTRPQIHMFYTSFGRRTHAIAVNNSDLWCRFPGWAWTGSLDVHGPHGVSELETMPTIGVPDSHQHLSCASLCFLRAAVTHLDTNALQLNSSCPWGRSLLNFQMMSLALSWSASFSKASCSHAL